MDQDYWYQAKGLGLWLLKPCFLRGPAVSPHVPSLMAGPVAYFCKSPSPRTQIRPWHKTWQYNRGRCPACSPGMLRHLPLASYLLLTPLLCSSPCCLSFEVFLSSLQKPSRLLLSWACLLLLWSRAILFLYWPLFPPSIPHLSFHISVCCGHCCLWSALLGTECPCLPPVHMLTCNPPCDGMGLQRWFGPEGSAILNGIRALKSHPRELPHTFPHVRTQWEGSWLRTERWFSSDSPPGLDLGLATPRKCEK